ncbi:MAG: hypothetical protein IPG04_20370 [Polyangiaceae bacterium]|nr:hypothetical protein [Polyangiaceae bacterium]
MTARTTPSSATPPREGSPRRSASTLNKAKRPAKKKTPRTSRRPPRTAPRAGAKRHRRGAPRARASPSRPRLRPRRRRQRRRTARTRTRTTTDEDEDEEEEEDEVAVARDPLPKDKNARAKELLRRRQESALGKSKTSGSAIGLSTGEVVQDQLARAASGTQRWLKTNFKLVLGGIAAALAIAGGVMFYLDRQDKARAASSDALIAALSNERGDVIAEGAPPSPMQAQLKETDPRPSFGTHAARADAALAAYEKVTAEHPSSGAAILARLGKAGIHLDRGEADAALSGFNEVLTTELAKADLDVRARATEGKAFALEAKKDHDGALNAFRELEGMDKSFEDLAKYHQARIHFRKGEKDRAKELLVALYKKLEVPPADGTPPQRKLRENVEQYLRAVDPQALPKKKQLASPFAAGRQPTEEEINAWIQEQMKQQGAGHGDDHGEAPDGMPTPPMPAPMPQAPAPGGDDDGTH